MKKNNTKEQLNFKVHLPNLLNEVMSNNSTWALHMPITITKSILGMMAEEAVKSGNKKWIGYCGRLGLYEACIPGNEGHEEMLKLIEGAKGWYPLHQSTGRRPGKGNAGTSGSGLIR